MNITLIIEMLYNSITFDAFLEFVIVYFFILWISILLWVIKDIWNRTDSMLLQIFSIFTVLFLTPLWIFIYLLIRPSKTLFEQYYEEIEDNLDIIKELIEERIEKNNKNKK